MSSRPFPASPIHKIIIIWTNIESKREIIRDIQQEPNPSNKQIKLLEQLEEEVADLIDYDLGDQMYELMSWRDNYYKRGEAT